jgi:hypothetical protein
MTGVGVEYQYLAICGNDSASLGNTIFYGETSWKICDIYSISKRRFSEYGLAVTKSGV